MNATSKVTLATIGLLVACAAMAEAQSATATVTATVQPAITVTVVRALSFGNITPGVARTVNEMSTTSGWMEVSMGSATVNLTFLLPTELADGPRRLPIGNWTGRAVPPLVFPTSFTPSSSPFSQASSGPLNVYFGATVTPAADQPPGTYSGTVTMTVTYL